MINFRNIFHEKALKESSKVGFIDEFGGYWGLVWILAVFVFWPFCAFMDGWVLFGIVYQGVEHQYISLVVAFVLAMALQGAAGGSVVKLTKCYRRGDHRKKGFGLQLFLIATIGGLCLLASGYLSWHTDKPVEVRQEQILEQETKDFAPIKNEYEEKRNEVRREFAAKRSVLTLERERLAGEKVANKAGEMVTRWLNLKSIRDINSNQLPELERTEKAAIDTLNAREGREIALILSGNAKREKLTKMRSNSLGMQYRGMNIFVMLFRMLLLVGCTVSFVDAVPKKKAAKPESWEYVAYTGTVKETVRPEKSETVRPEKSETVKETDNGKRITEKERINVPKGTDKRSKHKRSSAKRFKTGTLDNCLECGTDIRHKRKGAKFCGSKCRVKHFKNK